MPLSARADLRTSRPSSASRLTSNPTRSTTSRLGTASTPNIGSSENIKNLYEQRGRTERPTTTTVKTTKPSSTIKPKQTATSLVRQKASKGQRSPSRGSSNVPVRTTMKSTPRTSKEVEMEKQFQEFKTQQNAIEELKRQFNQLQIQVAQVSQNELITQENERLKDQLANMSQVMANIQYKRVVKVDLIQDTFHKFDGLSTPDSLSDQETSKNVLKDKRLSIAEELDATQNELKEAEERLSEALGQNEDLNRERDDITNRLNEQIDTPPPDATLMERLNLALEGGTKAFHRLQVQLHDTEEENEGIKREMSEMKKPSSDDTGEHDELRNTIFELESQLNRRNNEYVDLVQMDQADRASTLEAIRNTFCAEHDVIGEKDELINALQVELSSKDQSHRRDLEELSEVIDDMQNDGLKKDFEMDELVQKLYQLQDAVEQQIAVKQFAEHERDKLQKEVYRLNEESIERDKEVISLRRLKEKHDEEKNSLHADMTSAITIAKDAKNANESEIRELRERNRKLEEENARLNVEVAQLRRDRRGSPVLKDEPVSPKSQFETERRLSSSTVTSSILGEEFRNRNRRNTTKEPPNVQNLIQNFNKDSDGDSSEPSVDQPTSPPAGTTVPSLLRRNLERRDSTQIKRDAQKSRDYLSERVSQLRAKAEIATKHTSEMTSKRPANDPLLRRGLIRGEDGQLVEGSHATSSGKDGSQNDPLQKLSKKYGCGSKRNALLKEGNNRYRLYTKFVF